jgi:hypothetical protein
MWKASDSQMTARALEVDSSQLSSTTVTRYRLDVIAADLADAIAAAGGWLFDRAMSGWDVSLHMADPSETRALQILGIKAHPLKLASERPFTHALAVSADVLNAEACVRDMVITMLDRGVTEVALWGDTWPPEFHRRAERIGHRLSRAARAFKGHALVAAALPAGSVSDTEAFHGGVPWGLPYESDLLSIN